MAAPGVPAPAYTDDLMLAVSKSAGATVANGALSLWVQTPAGLLCDVFSAAFSIENAAGDEVVERAELDVVGSRLGVGHYAAVWAPDPDDDEVGRYLVRWFYTVADGDDEQSFAQEVELVDRPYSGPHYCTVYDLLDEGLSSSVPAARAQAMIVRASRYVEHFTGRTFDGTRKTIRVNGTGGRALLLNEPIIALEATRITLTTGFGSSDVVAPEDAIQVYNRHLTQGLFDPDDRNNPKLEFVHGDDLGGVNFNVDEQTGYRLLSLVWPRGRQNVQLSGLFGFTEPDGSHIGKTPDLVREAAKLFVFRHSEAMSSRAGSPTDAFVTQEATRDQSVSYRGATPGASGSGFASLTADWEIDQLLIGFIRPPRLGAA